MPATHSPVTGDTAERCRALLTLARDGDRTAFGEVYLLTLDHLRRRLWKCPATRPLFDLDPTGVDDVLHDAYTAAWQRIARFDPARGGLRWLWTIAHNTAVTVLRRLGRRKTGGSNVLAVAEPAAKTEPAGRDEQAGRIDRLRECLTERERAVFDGRFVGGRSYRELADELSVPEGAVAGLVHRLRARLRRSHRECAAAV